MTKRVTEGNGSPVNRATLNDVIATVNERHNSLERLFTEKFGSVERVISVHDSRISDQDKRIGRVEKRGWLLTGGLAMLWILVKIYYKI